MKKIERESNNIALHSLIHRKRMTYIYRDREKVEKRGREKHRSNNIVYCFSLSYTQREIYIQKEIDAWRKRVKQREREGGKERQC